MPKHTPGPWRATADGYQIIDPTGIHVLGETFWDDLGVSLDRDEAQAMADANAKLMAAAPDLLAACQEFVRKVECGEARSKRSYAQMKAAIEKATTSENG